MIDVLAVVTSKNGRNSIVCSSVSEAENICLAMKDLDRHATVAVRIPMPHGASVVLDATQLLALDRFLDLNKIDLANVAAELRSFRPEPPQKASSTGKLTPRNSV